MVQEDEGRALSGCAAVLLAAAAAFAATAVFRFLAIEGFSNDHFSHLTGAQQILFGDLPSRDFVDPGHPLAFIVSAVGQLLLGRTLLAEAIVVATMFGLAAALTVAGVRGLTGSLWLGVAAAAVEVLAFPYTYGYPKVLSYALAFWLFGRYVTAPTTGRLVLMAAAVAVAFLFRHDHGLYLGVGGLLTAVLVPPRSVRRGVGFAAAVTVMVLPYLMYVHAAEGLGIYLRTALSLSRGTALREPHVWPNPLTWPAFAEAALLYAYYAVPVAALLALAATRRADDAARRVARVLPVAVVGLMATFGLIRGLPLTGRLPDPIVPAVFVAAWLACCAVTVRRRVVALAVAAVLFVPLGYWAASVSGIREHLDRAGLLDSWRRVPAHLSDRSAELRERFADSQMPPTIRSLVPFLRYVDRCTAAHHRVFVFGFLPEVPYYARRPFGGGAHVMLYYVSDEAQSQLFSRWRQQLVPFALIPSNYRADLDAGFPRVAEYLAERYEPLTDVRVDDELTIHILVDRQMAATRAQDAETGWPCFAEAGSRQ